MCLSSCIAVHTASPRLCKAPYWIYNESQVLSLPRSSFVARRRHPRYNIDLNNRYLDIDFGIRLSTLRSSCCSSPRNNCCNFPRNNCCSSPRSSCCSSRDCFRYSPSYSAPLNHSLGIVHHIHLESFFFVFRMGESSRKGFSDVGQIDFLLPHHNSHYCCPRPRYLCSCMNFDYTHPYTRSHQLSNSREPATLSPERCCL